LPQDGAAARVGHSDSPILRRIDSPAE
jgi:hypothetical protein